MLHQLLFLCHIKLSPDRSRIVTLTGNRQNVAACMEREFSLCQCNLRAILILHAEHIVFVRFHRLLIFHGAYDLCRLVCLLLELVCVFQGKSRGQRRVVCDVRSVPLCGDIRRQDQEVAVDSLRVVPFARDGHIGTFLTEMACNICYLFTCFPGIGDLRGAACLQRFSILTGLHSIRITDIFYSIIFSFLQKRCTVTVIYGHRRF